MMPSSFQVVCKKKIKLKCIVSDKWSSCLQLPRRLCLNCGSLFEIVSCAVWERNLHTLTSYREKGRNLISLPSIILLKPDLLLFEFLSNQKTVYTQIIRETNSPKFKSCIHGAKCIYFPKIQLLAIGFVKQSTFHIHLLRKIVTFITEVCTPNK